MSYYTTGLVHHMLNVAEKLSYQEPTRHKPTGAQKHLKRWREPPFMLKVEKPSDQWQTAEILADQPCGGTFKKKVKEVGKKCRV